MALWVMTQSWGPKQSRAFMFNVLAGGMFPLSLFHLVQYQGEAAVGLLIGAMGLPLIFIGTQVGLKIGNAWPRERLVKVSLVVLTIIGLRALLGPLLFS